MSGSTLRFPGDHGGDEAETRREAARALRAARSGPARARVAAIDRAIELRPDCRHARRLEIETLLDRGDLAAANTLVARGLLQHPTDPALSLLRARCLLAQGDARWAEREIRLVLRGRPRHVATLLLAAKAARACGDEPTAVRRLEEAAALRPDSETIRGLLAETLLDGGALDRAEAEIRNMTAPPTLLRARLARGRGRWHEAVDMLQAAGRSPAPKDHPGPLLCGLIDLLEELGEDERLRAVLTEFEPADGEALVRVARGWLSLGFFRVAAVRSATLRNDPRLAHHGLAVVAVAAAMLGRIRLARRALDRLRQLPGIVDPAFLADLWRRALTARAFRDPRPGHGQAIDTDARGSVLAPLLTGAIETFTREAERRRRRRSDVTAACERHRAVCLAALGRRSEAQEALGRGLAVTEPMAQTAYSA